MAPNNWHTSKIEIHGQNKESFVKDFPAKRTGVNFINILQAQIPKVQKGQMA